MPADQELVLSWYGRTMSGASKGATNAAGGLCAAAMMAMLSGLGLGHWLGRLLSEGCEPV